MRDELKKIRVEHQVFVQKIKDKSFSASLKEDMDDQLEMNSDSKFFGEVITKDEIKASRLQSQSKSRGERNTNKNVDSSNIEDSSRNQTGNTLKRKQLTKPIEGNHLSVKRRGEVGQLVEEDSASSEENNSRSQNSRQMPSSQIKKGRKSHLEI